MRVNVSVLMRLCWDARARITRPRCDGRPSPPGTTTIVYGAHNECFYNKVQVGELCVYV